MAILNRPTFKSKVADFINRVAPFTDPLIQKTEDNTIRDDMADSAVFKDPEVGSIVSPVAAFNVDFTTDDQINIDTSASGATSFTVTIVGLSVNSIGKLNITKKSGDVFAFANADIYPMFSNLGQDGKTSIGFIIENDGGKFIANASYDFVTNQFFYLKLDASSSPMETAWYSVANWKMNVDPTHSVTWASTGLGASEISNVISVEAFIVSDAGTNKYPLNSYSSQACQGGVSLVDTTNINFERLTGGIFDNANYSDAEVKILVHFSK